MNKQFATVKFENSTTGYSFMHDIAGLSFGDRVVCDTARGLSLGTVTSVDLSHRAKESATKWIVQVIDMGAHIRRMEAVQREEEQRTAKVNRRKALTKELDNRIKAFRQAHEIELLKQQDPDVELIIQELKNLENI